MMSRIKLKEKRLAKQKKLIADFGSDFREYTIRQFMSGEVDHLFFEMNEYYKIADGWKATLIEEDTTYDKYYCKAKANSILPTHNHVQIEHITIESGTMMIKTFDREGKPKGEHLLRAGCDLVIEPYLRHKCIAKSDVNFTVTFRPPIGVMYNAE